MRLPVDPWRFLARLSLWFVGCFLVWLYLGPWYTRLLALTAEVGASLADRATHVWSEGTTLYFWPKGFATPQRPPAIAAEWIQANTILLFAFMAATPAPTWKGKARRMSLAFLLVLAWQTLDIVLAIKFGYATQIDPRAYTERARYVYAFATNVAMYVDTQVVPFMIWAGIHFRELLGLVGNQGKSEPERAGTRPARVRRA